MIFFPSRHIKHDCYLLILTTIGEQLGLSFQAWKIIYFWRSNLDISRYFHLLCKLLRNEFRSYIKEFLISSNTFYLEVFCLKKKQLSFGNLFIYFVFKTFNVFLRSLIGFFLSVFSSFPQVHHEALKILSLEGISLSLQGCNNGKYELWHLSVFYWFSSKLPTFLLTPLLFKLQHVRKNSQFSQTSDTTLEGWQST